MAACDIQGHPELYGLGIRLSFYVAWASCIIVELIDQATSLAPVRFVTLLLSLSAAISLIVQVASDNIAGAEIYVLLLLAAGTYLFLVPLYIWRGLTLCNPFWDILRWTRERQSPIYKGSSFLLLLTVSGIATWFFITFLGENDTDYSGCSQYGFFFGQVHLSNKTWRAFNAMLFLVILLVCLWVLLVKLSWLEVRMWRKEHKRKKIGAGHREVLYLLRTLSNAAVFGSLVAGVELTLQWNNLDGSADGIGTLAQLAPLVVTVGVALRTVFLYYADSEGDDDDNETVARSRSSRSVKHRHYRTRTTERTRTTYRTSGGSEGAWPQSPETAHTKEG